MVLIFSCTILHDHIKQSCRIKSRMDHLMWGPYAIMVINSYSGSAVSPWISFW